MEIKSEKEYDECIKRLENLFDALPNTPEGDELDLLVKLIEEYESKNYPI